MNEMYLLSIDMHNLGIYGMLIVIFINFYITKQTKEISKLRRFMTIFTPIGSVMLGFIIFTGTIMMAAKHLDFNLQNIVMIIVALILIILEVKRAKALKYLPKEEFENYKLKAYKILISETVITVITVGFIHATLKSAI
jgi:hypothetical protein